MWSLVNPPHADLCLPFYSSLSRLSPASPTALSQECNLPRTGILQATRIFHTRQSHLAPLPPLPGYGGKVRLGLIPEEFFQFLYPKTYLTTNISINFCNSSHPED
uniref:ATP synthase subunit b n=1 Tax=Spermophilus dauricus TaxID=99837 RepID=A0A8C9QKZ3_SPEDA